MAGQGGNNVMRDYRKGNWTLSETMVLIEAKKMDDERRMKKSGDSSEGRSKPAELRWKWVEDYCWRKGCLRSQNQCNDKWDNLMRDFKKVRDYERRVAETNGNNEVSYWKMEKNVRKEKNLPGNILSEIYEALVEVVERKAGQRMVSGGGSTPNPNIGGYVVDRPFVSVQPSLPPPQLQHQISAPIPPLLTLPAPPAPAPAQAQAQPPPLSYSQPLPTVDSDTSEYSDSPAKRRRRRGGNGEGTSGTATASTSHEVGNAISKSASIIADALLACDEREERRYRDLLTLQERRLKIEESKTEINKQGINGLVDAINKLANSILALASHKNQSAPPK
ncbi:Myb_DNA-bind_4 domain-containing protein [Cephalotus follicularis]|uniref:Myb_DNA-bind_4 domain-containing protein n=1 Tax=Cephalotus follicularis TaxID=3775 RepID=A0A1Q3C126_CEPFO|nr:Myb_DNA-bind_4 domain-containing protein [Cephalotus follicularis]